MYTNLTLQDFTLTLFESTNQTRSLEPVCHGIPFPKGVVKDAQGFVFWDKEYNTVPTQTEVLARWPDQSVRWLLVDTQVSLQAGQAIELKLDKFNSKCEQFVSRIRIQEDADGWLVDTGEVIFRVDGTEFRPFGQVTVGGRNVLAENDFAIIDADGKCWRPKLEENDWETIGPLRATLKQRGWVMPGKLRFMARLHFFVGRTSMKMEITLHNSQRAQHKGGLWDLGDPGSVYFKDAALSLTLASSDKTAIQYITELHNPLQRTQDTLEIYQDSSGGDNWQSHNHVNRNGDIPLTFQGYRVKQNGSLKFEGNRAQPLIAISDSASSIAVTLRDFWQNFPKAIEVAENTITVRLFPQKFQDRFELQGGEQKTHTLFCDFGKTQGSLQQLANALLPLQVRIPTEWYEACGLIESLPQTLDEQQQTMFDLVQSAVVGDNSFFARREIIDEYGWRNFGDLYADHEAIGHQGDQPLISHYNNQYDVIYAALRQYLHDGNQDWFILAGQLAHHVVDIDIYHTDSDRMEYNHGLFWHTGHYLDAQTCTHRSASRKHLPYVNGPYGGGPSPSHLYSTGLLLHYYLTGDRAFYYAVKELATFAVNNIEASESFSRKLRDFIKRIITNTETIWQQHGIVHHNKVYDLDGPGRASGNTLSTLLDAYVLFKKSIYLEYAEKLICKCISPDDNIAERDFGDVENRWMYTVFLQALGKYLDLKIELSRRDEMYGYAKNSLLTYARWMLENEYIYLSNPEKLEYPNETWAAQELRKCAVLLYAAKHSENSEQSVFKSKADYFFSEGIRRLESFETKTLTRPIALVLQNAMTRFGLCSELQ